MLVLIATAFNSVMVSLTGFRVTVLPMSTGAARGISLGSAVFRDEN